MNVARLLAETAAALPGAVALCDGAEPLLDYGAFAGRPYADARPGAEAGLACGVARHEQPRHVGVLEPVRATPRRSAGIRA